MSISQKAADRGGKFWARLCALPTFSFLLNGAGGVARVKDPSGNWVELHEVQQIVDDAESCIAQLETLAAENLVSGHATPAQEHATQLVGQALRPYISHVQSVADLVNNLLLLDQTLPIYGAQYIEHPPGKRRAIAVPPTVSRERVKDSRWIGEGDTLNAAVIWTRAEQPAAPAQAQEDAHDTLGQAARAMVAEMERQDRTTADQKTGEANP